MKPLTSEDIRGNWGTLLSSWNEDGSLDSGRVASQIDALIAASVDGIYCNGTAGEFHAQTESEFDRIAELLASKCEAAGVAFQIGVAHMSAQISLERLQRSRPLRPGAFQVILPDWFPVTEQEAIAFMSRMAEAAQGIGLVLYNPPHAKVSLSPEQIARIASRVPGLVGVKLAGGDEAWYARMRTHLSRLSVFIPGHHYVTGILQGAHGSYSNVACLNPAVAQWWADLTRVDLPAAVELQERILHFMEGHIAPFITRERYCNAACDRLLALVGGWADVGDQMRWPYRSIPVSSVAAVRSSARQLLPEFFREV